jgi:signal transduction histidine kinase
MRLAAFIMREMESILEAWEAFAATCQPAAGHMESLELRDHAQQILEAIALDLSSSQSREEQIAKSKGLAVAPFPARETAAQIHAVLRAKRGFDVKQLVSEYRALRASVLGLWMDATPRDELLLEDVIRFNEAIDQALAESIGHFSSLVEQSRNLLLGMLSHDMRSPLQAIQMTAVHLGKMNAGEAISEAARRLVKSGGHMQALLDDLVDFNRSNLGIGIGIVPQAVDLGALCREEVEQVRAGHPGSRVDLRVSGDCHGSFDGKRVQQLLGNLIINAITHGRADAPVRVTVDCRESAILIEVSNQGPPIPRTTLEQIFEPLKRGAGARDSAGLGLGLYIVSQIAKAHGGDVQARSDDDETVFSVRLPRFPNSPG